MVFKRGHIAWNNGKKTGLSWNRGLTKETSTKVLENGRNISKALEIKGIWNKGKHLSLGQIAKLSISRRNYRATEETKKKISESHKGNTWGFKKGNKINLGRKQNEKERAWRQVINRLEKNPNWNGGTSRLPYPPIWFHVNKKIKERDSHACRNCGKNNCTLTIHHINYDKNNCEENNLITLCYHCHNLTNNIHHREYWKAHYMKIMECEKECLIPFAKNV